jgi:hypothetical protein
MKGKEMKMNKNRILAVLIALALFLSACGGSATPDAAAIATSAVQTVEARYTATAQAAAQPTGTSTVAPTDAAPSDATVTATPMATSTPQPLGPNGKPCYAASVQDITIPDGMLIDPGSAFTKTWRMLNMGNCVWDSTYALTFITGDALGTILKVPLTTRVLPGQSVDISVDMTAPTADGTYKGYWRMATPYGGTFGVGTYDQSIYVQILVSSKPNRDTGVSITSIGLYSRTPQTGCADTNIAATYTISATISANAAIDKVYFHWNQFPFDGSKPVEYKISFSAPGSKTVTWQWNLQHESIQGITRYVSLTIDSGNADGLTSQKLPFTFTCN